LLPAPEDEDGLMKAFVRPGLHQQYYEVMRDYLLLIVERTTQMQP
jgi:hypothetical protein